MVATWLPLMKVLRVMVLLLKKRTPTGATAEIRRSTLSKRMQNVTLSLGVDHAPASVILIGTGVDPSV
jgi:hypothetical protein